MWDIITWLECAMQHCRCYVKWLLINDVVFGFKMLVVFMSRAVVIGRILVLRHIDGMNVPIVC